MTCLSRAPLPAAGMPDALMARDDGQLRPRSKLSQGLAWSRVEGEKRPGAGLDVPVAITDMEVLSKPRASKAWRPMLKAFHQCTYSRSTGTIRWCETKGSDSVANARANHLPQARLAPRSLPLFHPRSAPSTSHLEKSAEQALIKTSPGPGSGTGTLAHRSTAPKVAVPDLQCEEVGAAPS